MDKKIFTEKLSQVAPGMKQKEFASIMGCSPAAVSKYLNPEKSDCPSVDMLARLAKHFNVSIDWLIGNSSQKQIAAQLTVRDVCRMLVELHSTGKLSLGAITVNEECHYPCTPDYPGSSRILKNNTYVTLYFRDWIDLTKVDITEAEELCQNGNDISSNNCINTFINRLKKISDMRAAGDLDQEMYERLLNSYLDDAPDIKY